MLPHYTSAPQKSHSNYNTTPSTHSLTLAQGPRRTSPTGLQHRPLHSGSPDSKPNPRTKYRDTDNNSSHTWSGHKASPPTKQRWTLEATRNSTPRPAQVQAPGSTPPQKTYPYSTTANSTSPCASGSTNPSKTTKPHAPKPPPFAPAQHPSDNTPATSSHAASGLTAQQGITRYETP